MTPIPSPSVSFAAPAAAVVPIAQPELKENATKEKDDIDHEKLFEAYPKTYDAYQFVDFLEPDDEIVCKKTPDTPTNLKRLTWTSALDYALTFFKTPEACLNGVMLKVGSKQFIALTSIKQSNEKDAKTIAYDRHLYYYSHRTEHENGMIEILDVISGLWSIVTTYGYQEQFEHEFNMYKALHQKGAYAGFCAKPFKLQVQINPDYTLFGLISPIAYNAKSIGAEGCKMLPGDRIRTCQQLMQHSAEYWSRGLIHNNIKPSNIFIKEGNICIGDWRLAVLRSPETYSTVQVTGSVEFSSTLDLRNIEAVQKTYRELRQLQAAADQITKAEDECREAFKQKDLFAIGITMFIFLTGCKPYNFGEEITSQIKEGWAKAQCPDHVITLVNRMLAFSPTDRISTQAAAEAWAKMDISDWEKASVLNKVKSVFRFFI